MKKEFTKKDNSKTATIKTIRSPAKHAAKASIKPAFKRKLAAPAKQREIQTAPKIGKISRSSVKLAVRYVAHKKA